MKVRDILTQPLPSNSSNDGSQISKLESELASRNIQTELSERYCSDANSNFEKPVCEYSKSEVKSG